MAEPRRSARQPILQVSGLDVYYGHSHALQGVDLTLEHGVLSVVGRNGMGKTTLCKTIMGLVRASGGSIRMERQDLTACSPRQIARLGVGYVPQGRRLWRSLSVDEHLRMTRGRAARRVDASSASTRPSRASPSARTMAAASSPAASSRCWRSRARCSPIRGS